MQVDSFALGILIRRHRRRLGLSQGDLGRKVGAKQPTVSYWEHGHILPTIHHIVALADIFGITADELLRVPPITDDENGEAA